MIIWLTGIPSSGKTTIALELANQLKSETTLVEVLDGDVVRQEMKNDLTWSKEDRGIQSHRVGWIANLLSRNNIIAICALISPYRIDRDLIRKSSNSTFIEVYVSCPLETCIKRDVKGLYKVGIKDLNLYEPPINPEVILDTSEQTVDECVAQILNLINV